MFGNKTLYTTVKCRSMTTKEEFVEMWDNCSDTVKKIRLTSGDCVFATGYIIILSSVDLIGNDWHIGIFGFKNIKGIECD